MPEAQHRSDPSCQWSDDKIADTLHPHMGWPAESAAEGEVEGWVPWLAQLEERCEAKKQLIAMVWGFNKGDGYHMLSLYFPPQKGGPEKHVQNIPKVNHQELNIEDTGYMTHRGLQFASPKPGRTPLRNPPSSGSVWDQRVGATAQRPPGRRSWGVRFKMGAKQNGDSHSMDWWLGKNLHRKPMVFMGF